MHSKTKCPRCGSLSAVLFGKTGNGSRRYRCNSCGRTFVGTTGTVMSHKRLDAKRLSLVINLMANDTKLEAIADAAGIAPNTAYLWRRKVYAAASESQKNVVLSGKVWIDKKLVPVNDKLEFLFPNGKKPRGVSRNQVCIACAVDSDGNRYAEVAGKGHITSAQCVRTYGNHIAKGSAIIHDGIFSHDRLISFVGGASEVYKSTTRESHAKLQPVNSFVAEIEHFLKVHPGIETGNLQPYLCWIAFKSELRGDEIGEKISKLIRICCETKATFKRKVR